MQGFGYVDWKFFGFRYTHQILQYYSAVLTWLWTLDFSVAVMLMTKTVSMRLALLGVSSISNFIVTWLRDSRVVCDLYTGLRSRFRCIAAWTTEKPT
jgi:hypothetical protein